MKANNYRNKKEELVVGEWKIDQESGILSNGIEKELILESRLAKLLSILLTNANTIVARHQLIDKIWEHSLVNEESLTRAISDLRKSLKQHFKHPPVNKTIPKRGYKLIVAESKGLPLGLRVIKYATYTVVAIVLIILIIRGLNY